MTSRTVARSIRFRSFVRCLSLVTGVAFLVCSAITTAHAQLQWKSPTGSGVKKNPIKQAQITVSQTMPAPTTADQVRLVQHEEPYQPDFVPVPHTIAQVPKPNTPSPAAILDTTRPESRPSYLQSQPAPMQQPATIPQSPMTTPSGITPIPFDEIEPGAPISTTTMSDYADYGNMYITTDQKGCPDPRAITKPMSQIGYDISMPQASDVPGECPINYGEYIPRNWATTCFQFKASALCTKANYFEDVDLERYGHSWGPFLQPVISGGKFFFTIPVLPYKMGLIPPGECVYTLGHYRPGSCAPYIIDPLPLSVRAGLIQAGAVVGAVYIIP